MTRNSTRRLAAPLARELCPEWIGDGLELSIREQILADALEGFPPPHTVRELLRSLEAGAHYHSSATLDLVEELRRRARDAPEEPLEALVA